MSRSMGITTCHSERKDKQIWHKRWRARERTLFNSTSFDELDSYLPILEKQVSNIWTMAKDGKQYWSIKQQAIIAEISAQKKGRTLGDCYDNAAMESWNHRFKVEAIHGEKFISRAIAQRNLL